MEYLQQELLAMFQRLAAAKDVPPAQVYRLEGYMQALIQTKRCQRQQLIQLMADCYQQAYHKAMPDLFPPTDDASLIPIPIAMCRAPVR